MPQIKLIAPLPEVHTARLRPALRARTRRLEPIVRAPSTRDREPKQSHDDERDAA